MARVKVANTIKMTVISTSRTTVSVQQALDTEAVKTFLLAQQLMKLTPVMIVT